jgi:immune inhibitor A
MRTLCSLAGRTTVAGALLCVTAVVLGSGTTAHGANTHGNPAHFGNRAGVKIKTATNADSNLGDDLVDSREAKRRALRQKALTEVLAGRAKPYRQGPSTIVRLGPDAGVESLGSRQPAQYVELAREKTDHIFVVLAEFSDVRHRDFPDRDTDHATPGPTRFDGPRHNQIPRPDPVADNSTIWQSDYSADYYRKLYFGAGPGVESLRTYYEHQSSGRYSVRGQVTDWVRVRYNEARYGRSNGYPCAKSICANTWALITDALNQWVADQKRQGRTNAQLKNELASFDQWDRYDHDHDGDFNEPDGYVDHFQLIHAGGDQADADPAQGEDAIWSHRWKAYSNLENEAGPGGNRDGGVEIGHTGLWVADYTIQPENGGLSVIAHEYGHDLGLPDDYDLTGGDSPMEWWSLMAQSRLSLPGEGIGAHPGDLGAWEKLQLGWLDYEIVPAGQQRVLRLGPEEYNSKDAQALLVVLPKKKTTTQLPHPPTGQQEWWSSEGDDLNSTLTRRVELPPGQARLTFQANWDIEDCGQDPCDYAYVEVDAGAGWKSVPGSITHASERNGVDGKSGGWKAATFDLSRYAGRSVGLRFRYDTDTSTGGQGLFLDDLALTAGGRVLFRDGAEDGDHGWKPAGGFLRTTQTHIADHDQYYLASYRTPIAADRYLANGPYNFGWLTDQPNRVERFSYEPGLLVTYWDTSRRDNNVSEHPGEGRNLIVDAHPRPLYRIDGTPWRARVQLFDAPFSGHRPRSFTLHVNGRASYLRGQDPAPTFDDTGRYWFPDAPASGVKLPAVGVRLTVLSENGPRATVRLSSVPRPRATPTATP